MILKFRNTQRRTEERHLCTVHAAFSSFSGGGVMLARSRTYVWSKVTFDLWVLEQAELDMNIITRWDTSMIQHLCCSLQEKKQNVNLTNLTYQKGKVLGGTVHTKYSPVSYEFQSKHVSHSVKVVMTLSRRKNWTTQNSKKCKSAEEKQQKKQKSFPPCWSLHKNTCRMQIGCTIHLKAVMFIHEASSL